MFRATSCSEQNSSFELRRFGRSCACILFHFILYTFIRERFDLLAISLSKCISLINSQGSLTGPYSKGNTSPRLRRGRIVVYACDCVPTLICEPRIPFSVHKANLIERYVRPDALSLIATDGPAAGRRKYASRFGSACGRLVITHSTGSKNASMPSFNRHYITQAFRSARQC